MSTSRKVSQANYLMDAAKTCDLTELSHLISTCGVSVNLQDVCGNTALHWVCQSRQPTRSVIQAVNLLIGLGADRSITNHNGHTAIHIASRWMESTAVISVIQNSTVMEQARYAKIASVFTPIVEYFASLVEADRATLFLVDERRHRLFSEIAVAGTIDRKGRIQVDIPWDKGLVGSCFQMIGIRHDDDLMDQNPAKWVRVGGFPDKISSRLPLRAQNVPDVTEDDDFYSGVDKEVTYKTESVMCVPIYRMSNLVEKLPQDKRNELLSAEEFDNFFVEEIDAQLSGGSKPRRDYSKPQVVGILQFLNKRSKLIASNRQNTSTFAPFTNEDCHTASSAINAMPKYWAGAEALNSIYGGVVDGSSFNMAVELAVRLDVAWELVMQHLQPCFQLMQQSKIVSAKRGIEQLVCEPGYHLDATLTTRRLVERSIDMDSNLSDWLRRFADILNFSETAGINKQARDGRTPLMNAVICGREDVVSTLLKNGALPYVADNRGDTALHLAAQSDNYAIVAKLILAACDPFAVNMRGQTPRDICDESIIQKVERANRHSRRSQVSGDNEVIYDAALHYLTSTGDRSMVVDRLQAYAEQDWLSVNLREPIFDKLRHGLHILSRRFRSMLKCRRRLLSAEAIWLRVLSRGHRNTWSSKIAEDFLNFQDKRAKLFHHPVTRKICPFTGQKRPVEYCFPLPPLPINVYQSSKFPHRTPKLPFDTNFRDKCESKWEESSAKIVTRTVEEQKKAKRKKKKKMKKKKAIIKMMNQMSKKKEISDLQNKDQESQVENSRISKFAVLDDEDKDENTVAHGDAENDSIYILWNLLHSSSDKRETEKSTRFFIIEASPPVDGLRIIAQISSNTARDIANMYMESSQNESSENGKELYGFQASGLQANIQYQFRITSVNNSGLSQPSPWSEIKLTTAQRRTSPRVNMFLRGRKEQNLRARYEYLEGCISYKQAVKRLEKGSAEAKRAKKSYKNDLDGGMGALLHEACPEYTAALRHMKHMRTESLRETRMRRNGQIFQFWANRDFVPLYGPEETITTIPGQGTKEKEQCRKNVSNFSGLQGLTFVVDVGLEDGEMKLDDTDYRYGREKRHILEVKTHVISRGTGCLSFRFADRHTGTPLQVRKSRSFKDAKICISAFCPPGGKYHNSPLYEKAWEKHAMTFMVRSRSVILTRGPESYFGNTVITIVCPSKCFHLSGVNYYVTVEQGAFEIANSIPTAVWFDSPILQQGLLSDRSQALWNRFTPCPKPLRKKIIIELQMAHASAAPPQHRYGLPVEKRNLERRTSLLNLRVLDPKIDAIGRALIKSHTPGMLFSAPKPKDSEKGVGSRHIHSFDITPPICDICSDHVQINPTFKRYPDENQNDTSYHPVGDENSKTARERCEVCGHMWTSPIHRHKMRTKYAKSMDAVSLRQASSAVTHFCMQLDASVHALRYLPYYIGGVDGFDYPEREATWYKVEESDGGSNQRKRVWKKSGSQIWVSFPCFTEYFIRKCVSIFFGDYVGPFLSGGHERPQLTYGANFFEFVDIGNGKTWHRNKFSFSLAGEEEQQQGSGASIPLITAEDVTEVHHEKDVSFVAGDSVPKALLIKEVDDPCSLAENALEKTSRRENSIPDEESSLFACLGFGIRSVDAHADVRVSAEKEDQKSNSAVNLPKKKSTIKRRTGLRPGRSAHDGSVSGMLGTQEISKLTGGAGINVDVPILAQPSSVMSKLKDILLGIVED